MMEYPEHEDEQNQVCRAIGSVVVCLHFLSREAKKDNIEGLASIIDDAITRTIKLGSGMHESKLKEVFEGELYAKIDEACIFIDRFCASEDPALKKQLASIVHDTLNFEGIRDTEIH